VGNITSLEEWKQCQAVEAMVVPCGTGKIHITWTPKLSEKDLGRLKKAEQGLRTLDEQFRNK